jgi:hypothetical protein
MTDHAATSEAASSIASIKTSTAVGVLGAAPAAAGTPALLPYMTSHYIGVLNYAEVCQIMGTLYLISIVITKIIETIRSAKNAKSKIKARRKS